MLNTENTVYDEVYVSLIGAHTKYGAPIKTYDDAFGQLWIYRDAGGYETIVLVSLIY